MQQTENPKTHGRWNENLFSFLFYFASRRIMVKMWSDTSPSYYKQSHKDIWNLRFPVKSLGKCCSLGKTVFFFFLPILICKWSPWEASLQSHLTLKRCLHWQKISSHVLFWNFSHNEIAYISLRLTELSVFSVSLYICWAHPSKLSIRIIAYCQDAIGSCK